MTIGIGNERCIVVGRVVFANARLSLVDAARAQGRRVEAIDGFVTWGGKGDVKAPTGTLRLGSGMDNRKGRLALESFRPVSRGYRVSPKTHVAERRERCIVECRGAIETLDPNGNVMACSEQGCTVQRPAIRRDHGRARRERVGGPARRSCARAHHAPPQRRAWTANGVTARSAARIPTTSPSTSSPALTGVCGRATTSGGVASDTSNPGSRRATSSSTSRGIHRSPRGITSADGCYGSP